MKKFNLIALILFSIGFVAFGEGIKLKADVKASYPIDLGDTQWDYYAISPSFDLKVEIPVYKNLGVVASGEYLFGNFSDELFGGYKVGKYQFISFLAGAFYNIDFNNGFSIIPALQIGYTQFIAKLNGNANSISEPHFSVLGSVEFEKKINEEWALYAVTSFGYYDVYSPLSLGIGAAYIF